MKTIISLLSASAVAVVFNSCAAPSSTALPPQGSHVVSHNHVDGSTHTHPSENIAKVSKSTPKPKVASKSVVKKPTNVSPPHPVFPSPTHGIPGQPC